jgi:hypothetical protein
MTITFECPNGHRLNCPATQAGKPGKCPKCGAVFRVPTPQATDGSVNAAAATGSGSAAQGQQLKEFERDQAPDDVADGEIIFLCPNGHRLHGPAEMVGRPGQCPHCGVRFLIPSPEDISEDEEEELSEENVDEALEEFVIQIDTATKEGSASSKSGVKAGGSTVAASEKLHPLAALLRQLWAHKARGASIEIHLGDGKLLIPDAYANPAAHPDYALFAVREANGSHTVTAIAWAAIQRISLRQLSEPPKELFS